MKTITEVIDNIGNDPIINDMTLKYKSNCAISGLILRKPKFIKHNNLGVESCSFVLYQIEKKLGKTTLMSYSCMTFSKELIKQLKTLNNVILVATVGILLYSPKIKGLYSQVIEMKTLCEFEEELAEEWRKKENV